MACFVLTDLSSTVAKSSKTFPPSTNRDRLSPFPSQLCGLNAGNNHRPADQKPWLCNSGKCWPHAAVNKKQKGQKQRKLKAAEATVVAGEWRCKKQSNKEPVPQIPTISQTLFCLNVFYESVLWVFRHQFWVCSIVQKRSQQRIKTGPSERTQHCRQIQGAEWVRLKECVLFQQKCLMSNSLCWWLQKPLWPLQMANIWNHALRYDLSWLACVPRFNSVTDWPEHLSIKRIG